MIVELATIEKNLGFKIKTLYALSNNIYKHYNAVLIPKRNGENRKLFVPDKILKLVQKAINNKLLILEKTSPCAMAYKKCTSVITNAFPHINKKQILKLDIENFFDNIRYVQVKEKVFPKDRYDEKTRILLSILCYYGEVLPQGAPTSPTISNIIMYDFDSEVASFCEKRNISYTRYCDDMTFSGNDFNAIEVIDFVVKKLKIDGFLLNRKKTKLISTNQQQNVTGIIVNKKLNIDKKYKNQVRQDVYYIKKYGLDSHLKNKNILLSKDKYLLSLLGKINFILQVNHNETFFEYKNYILKEIKLLNF